MAAPSISNYGPKGESHFLNAAAATVTMDLPAPPSGVRHVINSIWLFALGTLTVFNVEVQKSDGTVIGRAGGQIGALSLHIPVLGDLRCVAGDATKIVLTATGATQVSITANVSKE